MLERFKAASEGVAANWERLLRMQGVLTLPSFSLFSWRRRRCKDLRAAEASARRATMALQELQRAADAAVEDAAAAAAAAAQLRL